MAYTITKQQYIDEWVVAFQRGETLLKSRVTEEMMNGGTSAVFSIQGAAPRMATRGTNGLIPSRNRTDSQITIPLQEKHSLEQRNNFDVFTASANLRQAMQNAGVKTLAREIDQTIIDALATATNSYNGGAAFTLTYGKVVEAISKLYQNDVTPEDEITVLWTPAAWARLMTFPQFTSSDYVGREYLLSGNTEARKFLNVVHMMHNGLPGAGTNAAQNFIFAKPAVGHAIGKQEHGVGYNEEHDYSFDRETLYDGAAILQQAGVLKVVTDDTAAFS